MPGLTPVRRCARSDCHNIVEGKGLYCSSKCSALTRNRRYYGTANGRAKKRRGWARDFQAHRAVLLDKHAARRQQKLFDEHPRKFIYKYWLGMETNSYGGLKHYPRMQDLLNSWTKRT